MMFPSIEYVVVQMRAPPEAQQGWQRLHRQTPPKVPT